MTNLWEEAEINKEEFLLHIILMSRKIIAEDTCGEDAETEDTNMILERLYQGIDQGIRCVRCPLAVLVSEFIRL